MVPSSFHPTVQTCNLNSDREDTVSGYGFILQCLSSRIIFLALDNLWVCKGELDLLLLQPVPAVDWPT